MVKRVVLAGISGAIVLTVWVFISNGIFRFTSRVEMQRLPNEGAIYAVLKSNNVVAFLGLFVAIVADMHEHGIGGYPLPEAGLVAAYRGISWLLCGLVIAWLVRRGRPAPALGQSSPA
jgi:hypothetical protein